MTHGENHANSSAHQVEKFLQERGLGHHFHAFAANHITMDMLATLTDADLRLMGILKMGERKRILIGLLGGQDTVPVGATHAQVAQASVQESSVADTKVSGAHPGARLEQPDVTDPIRGPGTSLVSREAPEGRGAATSTPPAGISVAIAAMAAAAAGAALVWYAQRQSTQSDNVRSMRPASAVPQAPVIQRAKLSPISPNSTPESPRMAPRRAPSPENVAQIAARSTSADQPTSHGPRVKWHKDTFSRTGNLDQARAHCAGLTSLGLQWRLPKQEEATAVRPDELEDVAMHGAHIWTLEPTEYFVAGAVDVRARVAKPIAVPSEIHGIRCVNASPPEHQWSDSGRFLVGPTTVFDSETSLTWQRQVESRFFSWDAAKKYCRRLTIRKNKWRLPTKKELTTLLWSAGSVFRTATSKFVDPEAFGGGVPGRFWTDSNSGRLAWFVGFDTGSAEDIGEVDAGNIFRVRCVR